MFSFESWAQSHRLPFEKRLHTIFQDRFPEKLAEATNYPLTTGGKRIRPLFVFAAAEAIGGFSEKSALCSALSVELIHTYSLVHDDLPCMDNDDFRRGKPTVHKKYGEAEALLVGDALLTEAFTILSDSPHLSQALPLIGKAAGISGMIGGQSIDIGFEGAIETVERLTLLHTKKTGALISVAIQLGGIAAQATPIQQEQLETYGNAVGLAFQLADDLLDAEEDQKADGPPNFVKLLGYQETKDRARQCYESAISAIQDLPNPQALKALAKFSIARSH